MSEIPNAHEHLERVEAHAHAHGAAPIIPLTIAGMAVVAAVLGSLESAASSRAMVARSTAAIRQGEATDSWSFYQATSIKKNMYDLFSVQPGAPDVEGMKAKAKKYGDDQAKIEAKAHEQEAAVHAQEDLSDHAMEQHHHLILATNAVHLAIALASISLVVGRRWLFTSSLAALVAAIGIGVWAVLV